MANKAVLILITLKLHVKNEWEKIEIECSLVNQILVRVIMNHMH